MRKKCTRVLALLLACGMTLGTLAGCGNNKEGSAKDTDTQVVENPGGENGEAAKDANAEPYTIDFYYINYNSPLKDLEDVQAAMSDILREKINADIVLHPIDSGAWSDKVNMMYVSQDKIDVICSSAGLSPDYSTSVAKGAFLELEELIQEYGQGIIDACGWDFISGTTLNGHIYGVPVLKEKGIAYGYIFNKELVEKYEFDLTTVKSYKDIEPMLQVIKEKEPGVTPLCMSGRDTRSLRNAAHCGDVYSDMFFVPCDTEDFQVIPWYEYEPELELLRWIREMYEAGYVNKSSLTDTDEGPMKAGNAFCMPYEMHPGKALELSSAWGLEVEQVFLCDNYMASTQSLGIMSSIGRTSRNPERVMQFLNLLYTDKELINLLVFGIEGKDYVKVSDGIITYPEGVTAESVGYANQGWLFGNQFNNYLRDTEDPEKWTKYEAFNEEAIISPVLGFVFDVSKVSVEMAAIDSVNSQYGMALHTGAIDPEANLEEYVGKLKDAGIEKVLEECQRQLDEWRAANGK